MPIAIRGLEGPFKGKTSTFDVDKKEITFGRRPDADFVFPSDMTSISRFHMTLELVNDRYRLAMQKDNPVYINGKLAVPGDELDLGESEIRLGKKDGPGFSVKVIESLQEMPQTDRSYKAQATAMDVAKRTRKRLAAAVVIIALAISGVVYFQVQQKAEQERILNSIQTAINANSEDKVDQVEAPEFNDILNDLRDSVYLVAQRSGDSVTSVGTAWSVAPGIVATNAHVAVVFDYTQEAGTDLILVSNEAPYNQLLVTDVYIHPHYEAFENALSEAQVFTDAGQRLDLVPGYDVALMWVENPEELAPPLTLANDDELHNLNAGDELAYIGYPAEGAVGGGHNPRAPVPQTQIARATAITDFFLVDGGFENNQLVQHSMPSHGGASGSPIFNRDGHVVAALNAGNVAFIEGQRIGTGIGVNFGQRSDLVQELLDDTVASVEDTRMGHWDDRLSGYRGLLDTLINYYSEDAGVRSSDLVSILDTEGALINQQGFSRPNTFFAVNLNRTGGYFFAAVADDQSDIDIYLVNAAGDILASNTELDHYPYISFSLDSSMTGNYRIYVTGVAEGDTFDIRGVLAP